MGLIIFFEGTCFLDLFPVFLFLCLVLSIWDSLLVEFFILFFMQVSFLYVRAFTMVERGLRVGLKLSWYQGLREALSLVFL